jgi:hypothetical protein
MKGISIKGSVEVVKSPNHLMNFTGTRIYANAERNMAFRQFFIFSDSSKGYSNRDVKGSKRLMKYAKIDCSFYTNHQKVDINKRSLRRLL